MSDIRTRFAPSPTGYMHVGGIRTALFAWLIAKKAGGTFVLRIEDTDKAREVDGSAAHIIECLTWLNIIPDEGPGAFGGEYAPYFQSERLPSYKEWAQKLIDDGRAYADPYSADELQAFRELAQKEKRPFLFRHHRPETPPVWDGTQALRFKSEPKAYTWHDDVMGDLPSGPEVIDDFIIMKSDGYPTYNFAHIIDDSEMKITHVIRGQEFLASTPNFLNLYEALGFTFPTFASVPPIMNEQGNKKLSKRDGAKDILAYREEGYLPEAMRNFLASLGWNDGTEQEVFSTEELIGSFSLDRVQKSGARFDENRLLWLNGAHIRSLSLESLYSYVSPVDDDVSRGTGFWPASAYNEDITVGYRTNVLALAQDRLKLFDDLRQFGYFFAEPARNEALLTDNKQLRKLTSDEQNDLLAKAHTSLESLETWNTESIQNSLNDLLTSTGQKPGILFSLIRIVVTWAPFSPALPETLEILGKETVLRRLDIATKAA
ncbi:glutamate--tRNA ligase [Candidatus Saccharibacteria bacterium]|nr:glutamate--tRNA ligase [Candidatus Saccharibacteria bacterium]